MLLRIAEVVNIIYLIPFEALLAEDIDRHDLLRHEEQFILIAQFGKVVGLLGIVLAHGAVELIGEFVDAHQFALHVEVGRRGGAACQPVVLAILHIILVLELRHGGDEHHIRRGALEQRGEGLRLIDEVALQKEEVVAADGLAAVPQRIHAVGLGIFGREDALYLGVFVAERLIFLPVVSCADDDAGDAAVDERLYAALHHRYATTWYKTLGYRLGHLSETRAHACCHDNCCHCIWLFGGNILRSLGV